MRKRIVVNIASMNIRSLLRVRLEAELAIRRRQFDPSCGRSPERSEMARSASC